MKLGDAAIERHGGHHGVLDGLPVDDGQDAGQSQADRADVGVGGAPGVVR